MSDSRFPDLPGGYPFPTLELEVLEEWKANRIFEPSCLTEDYENGVRLHLMGCSQMFMPIWFHNGEPVATREYFPRNLPSAIPQRTRWVTGIALQTWQRHGWRGGIGTKYWLWRDRKGLIGNPVSFLTSLVFLYGALSLAVCEATGQAWGMGQAMSSPLLAGLMLSTTLLQAVHMGVRTWCTSRVYGWRFAAWAPVRTLLGNYINFRATLGAMWRYAASRIHKRPLVWLKTEHTYPFAPAAARPLTLAEVLVSAGTVSAEDLALALEHKPAHLRLEEFLLERQWLKEDQLYAAMSVVSKVPLAQVEPWRVRRRVARSLPLHVVNRWRVLPFRVSGGHLFVAATEAPAIEIVHQLEKFTRLPLRFHLVTPSNFEQLRKELLL